MLDWGKGKKGEGMTFGFDLEEQIKDQKYREKLEERIDDHVGMIQKGMREGESEKDFKRLRSVMQGYLGLQKVLARTQMQHIKKGDLK